jgi:Uma2 family endonuclease
MTTETIHVVVRANHIPGPPQGQWTYADYLALPDDGYRYEIIDGVLYMAPAPIIPHQRFLLWLGRRLLAVVEDPGLGVVIPEPDVVLNGVVFRPDLAVVLNEQISIMDEKKIVGAPDLIVEIASPSTAAYDRDSAEGKQGAYTRSGVREYWIVDPATRTIEVLALTGDVYESLGVFVGHSILPSRVLAGALVVVQDCFPR